MGILGIEERRRKTARLLAIVSALSLIFYAVSVQALSAQNKDETLSNFDVFNRTGQECHGFEIELDGVSSADITYTFGGAYIRYGDPQIVDFPGGVYVRYLSPYDPATGQFLQTTPMAPSVTTSADGHACYAGSIGNYDTSGCEHFGVGIKVNPTKTVYNWLVADANNPGMLAYSSAPVNIGAPVWNVVPPDPSAANQDPVVQAVLPAPDRAVREFGDAQWVKVFKTESPNPVQLAELLTDSPAVPQAAQEIEVEWYLLQASISGLRSQIVNQAQLGAGSQSVVRRYEFYEYIGAYDQVTHEVSPVTDQTPVPEDLGNYIGAQIGAVNILPPVILPPVIFPPLTVEASGLPGGKVGVRYATTALVTGGAIPYDISITGGAVPAGLSVNADGTLSGIPTEAVDAGSFSVDVRDQAGQSASGVFVITIIPALTVSTASLPSTTVGTLYSASLLATGGVSPYTWSLVAGNLPSGVTLQKESVRLRVRTRTGYRFLPSAYGLIFGTPDESGIFNFTVELTDGLGVAAQTDLSLTVDPAPSSACSEILVQGEGTIEAIGDNYLKINGVTVYIDSSTEISYDEVAGFAVGLRAQYKGVKDSTCTVTATSLEVKVE